MNRETTRFDMAQVSTKVRPKAFHEVDMYAIFRVERPSHSQDAWLVNLSRGARPIRKSFSDDTYGGKEPALFVARAYRDAVLKIVPPLTHRDMRMRVRRNRPEGSITGVHFKPASGSRPAYWIARIEVEAAEHSMAKRKRRCLTRYFSVARYGDTEAKRMAEDERIRMVMAVDNSEDPALRSPAGLALHEIRHEL